MFFIDFHQTLYIGSDIILCKKFIQFTNAFFDFSDTIFNLFDLILAFSFLGLFFLLPLIVVPSGGFRRDIVRMYIIRKRIRSYNCLKTTGRIDGRMFLLFKIMVIIT